MANDSNIRLDANVKMGMEDNIGNVVEWSHLSEMHSVIGIPIHLNQPVRYMWNNYIITSRLYMH